MERNLGNFFGLLSKRAPSSAFQEKGKSGSVGISGIINNNERNPRVAGENRYRVAQDIIYNCSAVVAGFRGFQTLVSRPKWSATPALDLGNGTKSSDAAKAGAEFAERLLEQPMESWPRIVRRMAAHKMYGFGIHEWVAGRRPDGLVGLGKLKIRPWHTIKKWDVDEHGNVLGVWQTPNTILNEVYLPRESFLYLCDDALQDSPEGLGLWRHMVDPWERMKVYLRLEAQGYERDLRGIPVGRAPLAQIDADTTKTPEQKKAMLDGIKNAVKMESKSADTGFVLDSATYEQVTSDGTAPSAQPMWDLELLTGNSSGFAELNNAILRLRFDMLMMMGMETMALGDTSSGSRALSQEKSRGLAMNIDSCIDEMCDAMNTDVLPMIWMLNGWPLSTLPNYKAESAAFKDIVAVTQALANIAQAGVMIDPADPAVNEVRLMAGLSKSVNAISSFEDDDEDESTPSSRGGTV